MTAYRLALLALCALAAQANGAWDNCEHGGNGVHQFFPATTVYLGRDAAVGDVVGPWITATAAPAWNCTRLPAHAGTDVQVSVQGNPPYGPKLGTLNHEGHTYGLYRFGSESEALGYIARWRAIVDGVATDWTALNTMPGTGSYQNSVSTVSVVKAAGAQYSINVETQIRLVKRTAALQPGYKQNIANPILVRHHQQVGGAESVGDTDTHRVSQMQQDALSFAGGGTCTTPNVEVPLPTLPASDFSGTGSVLGSTPFELKFQACPVGLVSIGYYFTPTTSIIDEAQAVVALDGSSTASGVGVQLTEDNGTALKFGINNSYSLPYDPSTGGSYSVPLKAAYYQTDNNLGAGSVSTSVTFTLDYK
ncbi:fimbrial protein [Ventosimonas gracilis]|uniref:fimbrial protein n=1 Tax=Ventosimonas gracilis TaxID=1680762 RepID=UPI00128F717E|nr:fimbrial protein [Ventosimonas gracilis]